jgi:tRNA threonylcarbamoyladenosine modification (KEOPS) complex Cgi121 subunit
MFKDSVVQFFKTRYILNPEHVFLACYFVQKAFYNRINISKTKNIELFLYLSAKRQIKNGLDAFGIRIEDLKMSTLTYCIISPVNNLNQINKEIFQHLSASEIEFNLELKNIEKYDTIRGFFDLSNNQINTVLKSYGIVGHQEKKELQNLVLALQDLICEKMSILSLEKTKT